MGGFRVSARFSCIETRAAVVDVGIARRARGKNTAVTCRDLAVDVAKHVRPQAPREAQRLDAEQAAARVYETIIAATTANHFKPCEPRPSPCLGEQIAFD